MSRTYGDRKDFGDKLVILKKKVKFLERENARLRKELAKLTSFLQNQTAQENPENNKKTKKMHIIPQEKRKQCSHCNSLNVSEMTLETRGGIRNYVVCLDCSKRTLVKDRE
jgi:RNase P subunit RPR2